MNISKNYIYLLCLSALFKSSLFAMRPGVNIPVVPSSWMAQGFSFGQPVRQPVQVAQINPELLRNAQEELRLEQPYVEQTQPVWSTQEMRPAYVVQQPRYTAAALQMDASQQAFQPEQKASLKRDTYQRFTGAGAQSGMFRSTAPHFMSRQQAASILGVSENPSPEELKSAYREAALKAHPDAGGSTKAMQDVNDARDALSGNVGASPNHKGRYNDFWDSEQDYRLWQAIKAKDEHKVADLINAGASLVSKGPMNATPLDNAIHNRNANIVKMLIDAGADVNAYDEYNNYSPLAVAVNMAGIIKNSDSDKIVEMLINAGAHVNKKNWDGSTPFDKAIISGNDRVIKLLFDAGAGTALQRMWYKAKGMFSEK